MTKVIGEGGAPGSVDEVRALIEARDARFVTVAYADLAGSLRGKLMSRERFLAALEEGYGIVQASFLLDPTDVQLEAPGVVDEQAGFADIAARIVPESACILPWARAGEDLFFLAEATDARGFLCPRRLFGRVENWAAELGYFARFGSELEFTILEGDARSARDSNYASLTPISIERTYDLVVREQMHGELLGDLLAMSVAAGVSIEAMHWEMGAGFVETAFSSGFGVGVCDKAVLFKNFSKIVAAKSGKLATFMARWSNDADGQGGHIHISLCDRHRKPVFHDNSAEASISEIFRNFIGGVQAYLHELFVLFAPNVNSYKRLAPGHFAPAQANWGVENRTCAMRVVGSSPQSLRMEFRVPGADANPYLATAGLILAGVQGIVERIEPSAPSAGNTYQGTDGTPLFPRSLRDAAGRFRNSSLARNVLGDAFVEAFAASRESQAQGFDKLVTDAELRRFLELG